MTYDTDHLESPMYRAAAEGDVDTLQQLLDNGADINAVNAYNNMPLIAAINSHVPKTPMGLQNWVHIIQLLLENGADVHEATQGFGMTALHYAVLSDNWDSEGNTPLLSAARSSSLEIAKLLLDAGADVNCQNSQGYTPVMLAVQWAPFDSDRSSRLESEIVKLLVSYGADLELQDDEGCSALQRAQIYENK